MIEKKIELMKNGYDPFLDFLKGFCILSVIFMHCEPRFNGYVLYDYWIHLAVPLFLLLQAYHVFRKENATITKSAITKMLRRIFLPFACFTAVEFVYIAVFRDGSLRGLIKSMILAGGIGPGSYYFWVYLQFFILAPLTYWLFRRFNISLIMGGAIFTIISIGTEIICSNMEMRTDLYRLSCMRYIYLIFLGYVWSRRGIRLNALTLTLSGVSIVFITIFTQTNLNLEPVFHNFTKKECHWICYFYPAFLFMFMLHWAYRILPQRIRAWMVEFGHYSWHIFLMQMLFFALFPKGRLLEMGDHHFTLPLFYCIAFAFSTIPVIALHRIKAINKTKI